MTGLTHIDARGAARMVDVSEKAATVREAVATGRITMSDDAQAAIRDGHAKKGDVLATARIAGIMAAKRTHELIPLCHPLALSKVEIAIVEIADGYEVQATVRNTGQTGVEMEALTAVSVTCLTVYDMAKAIDRNMRVTGIRLLSKSGGRSGSWAVP